MKQIYPNTRAHEVAYFILSHHRAVKTTEISKETGIAGNNAYNYAQKLVRDGLAVRYPDKYGVSVYSLTTAGVKAVEQLGKPVVQGVGPRRFVAPWTGKGPVAAKGGKTASAALLAARAEAKPAKAAPVAAESVAEAAPASVADAAASALDPIVDVYNRAMALYTGETNISKARIYLNAAWGLKAAFPGNFGMK
jgi:DNA-binding MarR family transcriptional regulator